LRGNLGDGGMEAILIAAIEGGARVAGAQL
jgi:hypothetical protein